MKIVYIFIIILNIFLIIKSQILYLSYLPFNGPYTILVGTKESDQYELYLNQEVQYSIFYDVEYSDKELIKTEKKKIRNKEISLSVIEQKLLIVNYTIPYQYYLIEKNSEREYSNSAISIIRKCEDEDKCLIHKLKKEKIINKNEYTFKKLTEENYEDKEGIMYIGDIPKNELEKNKYVEKCKINPDSIYWECKLRGIFFGENYTKKYEMNTTNIHFNVGSEDFQIPEDFYNYFKNEILRPLTGKGWCRYYSIEEKGDYQCMKKAFKSIPDITLLIGNIYLTFPSYILFEYTQDYLDDTQFYFLNFEINDDNKWVLGGRFANYYMTRFSYDEGTISFYSDEKFTIDKSYNEFGSSVAKFWIVLNLVICLIGTGIMGYVKYMSGKNQNYFEIE